MPGGMTVPTHWPSSLSYPTERGQTLPWSTVRDAIDAGIQARWVELSPDSGPWPCELNCRSARGYPDA